MLIESLIEITDEIIAHFLPIRRHSDGVSLDFQLHIFAKSSVFSCIPVSNNKLSKHYETESIEMLTASAFGICKRPKPKANENRGLYGLFCLSDTPEWTLDVACWTLYVVRCTLYVELCSIYQVLVNKCLATALSGRPARPSRMHAGALSGAHLCRAWSTHSSCDM